jgi:hypothetical protein
LKRGEPDGGGGRERFGPTVALFVNLTPHSSQPPDLSITKQSVESQLHSRLPSLRRVFTQVAVGRNLPAPARIEWRSNATRSRLTAPKQAQSAIERQKIGARRFLGGPLVDKRFVAQRRPVGYRMSGPGFLQTGG